PESARGLARTTTTEPARRPTKGSKRDTDFDRITTTPNRKYSAEWNYFPGGASCPIGLSCPGCALTHCLKVPSSGVLIDTCKVRRKCTKSHASSGLMLSAKDGIGVPSRPVMKIR